MLLKKPLTVKFDPAIKPHRAAVQAFLKRKAWGDATVRFSHQPEYGNSSVAEQVQIQLLEWYMNKEKFPVVEKLVPTKIGVIHASIHYASV